mmetsp:Transcript_6770/g.22176  ORF Transcript_6770/g.22176 Transcript_6770/m.22176 type:complete len:219 (-) Transcript_6770:120-776(-)
MSIRSRSSRSRTPASPSRPYLRALSKPTTVACSLADSGSLRAANSVSSPARRAFAATVSSSTSSNACSRPDAKSEHRSMREANRFSKASRASTRAQTSHTRCGAGPTPVYLWVQPVPPPEVVGAEGAAAVTAVVPTPPQREPGRLVPCRCCNRHLACRGRRDRGGKARGGGRFGCRGRSGDDAKARGAGVVLGGRRGRQHGAACALHFAYHIPYARPL